MSMMTLPQLQGTPQQIGMRLAATVIRPLVHEAALKMEAAHFADFMSALIVGFATVVTEQLAPAGAHEAINAMHRVVDDCAEAERLAAATQQH